jgi:hypothetical protein
MDWDEVGAISQALGSIAVLVTLVYLAMQTRHANHEASRSFFEAHHVGIFQLVNSRAANERVNRLMLKARLALNAEPPVFVQRLVERAGMTMEDALIVYWDMASDWMFRLQFLESAEQMPANKRAAMEWPFIMTYKHDPVGRLWWESVKPHISLGNPSMARYVEELLARDGYNDHYFYTKAVSASTGSPGSETARIDNHLAQPG